MKYLIIILLICSGLLSCKNSVTLNNDRVIRVGIWDEKNAIYTTFGKDRGLDADEPQFIAPIGLYNVGDTINFTK